MMAAAGLAWQPGLAALVKAGGDVNGTYRNYRPLHALIQEDPHKTSTTTSVRVACLEWLLAHGADPELPGAWPAARALVIAAFQGEWVYVAALRKAGAQINSFTASALGDDRRLTAFVERDAAAAAASDAGGRLTPLHCCAGSRLGRTRPKRAAGLLACAQRLVAAGADVNARAVSWGREVSVAHFAIRSGQVDLLRLLLDHRADPIEALPTAAWDGHWEIVDLLRARGASLDDARDGDRPLLNNLVRWGQFQQARQLLARGASPNVADANGWTAMHQAASRGNTGIWTSLVDAGGDVSRRDRAGRTPGEVASGRALSRLIGKITRAR